MGLLLFGVLASVLAKQFGRVHVDTTSVAANG